MSGSCVATAGWPGRAWSGSSGSGVTTELRGARGVLLNTGTEPLRLDIDGLAETPYWTNREAMKVTEVPRRLVVIGGGPNGLELAQVFARYGAEVTLLEVEDRIAAQEEPEASQALTAVLRDEGIDVRAGVEVERVDHDGEFHLRVDGEELTSDQLLVAAGRNPNLADIGLETVGLDPGSDTVEIDDRMRAGERLWAVGDITGKGAFTHISRYQAAGAVSDILGDDGPPADYRAVSRVTFTDPELASVGLTEEQAREQGLTRPGRAGRHHQVRAGLAARPGHHRRGQGGRGRRPRGAGGRDRRGAVRRRGDRAAGRPPCTPRCRWLGCGRCTTPTRPSTGRSRRR